MRLTHHVCFIVHILPFPSLQHPHPSLIYIIVATIHQQVPAMLQPAVVSATSWTSNLFNSLQYRARQVAAKWDELKAATRMLNDERTTIVQGICYLFQHH
jgi:hypothetical protein